jgi:hypothetical protein
MNAHTVLEDVEIFADQEARRVAQVQACEKARRLLTEIGTKLTETALQRAFNLAWVEAYHKAYVSEFLRLKGARSLCNP